ncbi:hypothetical protein N8I77_011991 [Diaporthe amygdali]|uniref:Uncharacterized protein n=1 Tax=Phomopsis amygdali TaxID=1214568 RepID=A0AAD9S6T5_PHOAM|nr:hypothetical protein N8I77_011991 [Diaporthe amygdali]
MAADTIRGDGLFQAHAALAALVEDQEQFDEARERRFSQSPPSYRSRSGTTTRTDSPAPVDEALDNYNARRDKLYLDWLASKAAEQFNAQSLEERRRIESTGEFVGADKSEFGVAAERVRERWIEQGIWDDKWYQSNLERWGEHVDNVPLLDAPWMHEVPLDDDSDTDDDYSPANFKFGAKRKRQKTEEETRQKAERRAERQRQRELTRPIHQFNYQVSQERERLLEERAQEAGHDDPVKRYPPDINTQAYTAVKDRWVNGGLWFEKWGILPGMTWLHEHNFDEVAEELLGPCPPPQPAVPASSDGSSTGSP